MDGDPSYTSVAQFFLSINGQTDCSGLKEFAVTGGGNPVPITGNAYNRAFALPGAATPGDKPVKVHVFDQIGNSDLYSRTLTYDPANTDTTGTLTDTKGLPVFDPSGSFTGGSVNSIIRDLQFQAISVTDNLYGIKEQLPAGRQFWGVWIANTTSPTATESSANLNWYPVRVPSPNSTFTVKWNLFTGLGLTGDLKNKTGTYFVFVRALDGAGNPSQRAIKATVTLTAGYSIPTVRLPMIVR